MKSDGLSAENPWHFSRENFSDSGHGRDLIHLTPNSQWRWHGLGHDPDFVADSSAHPSVLKLVEVRFQEKNLDFLLKNLNFRFKNLDFIIKNLHFIIKQALLGGPVKRPRRNRGIYSIFPRDQTRDRPTSTSTFDSPADQEAPPEAQLNPHADMQPFEMGGATYFSKVGARSGGFTIWPGSDLHHN